MQAEFWQQCWQQQRIGFHQAQWHPWLAILTSQLALTRPQRCFVPLCGKSLDMLWWAELGTVIGAELSSLACEQFYLEQDWPVTVQPAGEHQSYLHPQVTILQGDFFALQPEQLGAVELIYDRAALIALPEAMRREYVRKLRQLCPVGRMMLLTFDYPQQEMTGPPFSVPDSEVRQLFSFADRIELLAVRNLTGRPFAQRQFHLTEARERAYLIEWTIDLE